MPSFTPHQARLLAMTLAQGASVRALMDVLVIKKIIDVGDVVGIKTRAMQSIGPMTADEDAERQKIGSEALIQLDHLFLMFEAVAGGAMPRSMPVTLAEE